MPAPSTSDEFLDLIRKSGVLDDKRLDAYLERATAAGSLPTEPSKLAGLLVRDAILTHFQAEQFLQGKWRRFTIGKYKVLERIGSGGMGSVYLCEHKLMRRRVAVKVLPTAKADDTSSLERFYREARAVAALDHANIVRAYDIDQDDKLHFLVMEYVDGASLQEMVKRAGPLDPIRAAHYIRQAALGLQHAHETAGLVHRDIKPGNILVDRSGTVKVLDMGLARFFHDEEDLLTKKYDENVLGTADYLAPEQALDSHSVDIRADIYSLGATFYYCLTGRSPFNEGTVAQKLIWHQTRQPKSILALRPDVPAQLVAIVEHMMAKDPAQRFSMPQAVVDALTPWTQQPIAPPPENEMPHLSPAAMGVASSVEASGTGPPVSCPGLNPPSSRKNWRVPPAPSARTPTAPATGQADVAAAQTTAPAGLPGPDPAPFRMPTPRTSSPAQARPKKNDGAPGTLPRGTGARPAGRDLSPFVAPRAVAIITPAPEPSAEEEAPPWEQLSPDTDDLTARADTAPHSGKKGGSSPKRFRSTAPTVLRDPKKRRVFWTILAVIVFIAVAGLTAVVAFALFRNPKSKTATESAPSGKTLYVGKGSEFPKIKDALRKAQPGDRIRVRDNIQEWILLDEKRYQFLTIESDDPSHPITWTFPDNTPETTPLLDIHSVEGVTVHGMIMDGGDRCRDVIRVFGNCPGVKLDDLKIKGFRLAGIVVSNAAGTTDRPIILSGLRFFSDDKPRDAAIRFKHLESIKELPQNQHIKVQKSCTIDKNIKVRDSVEPGSNDASVELEQ